LGRIIYIPTVRVEDMYSGGERTNYCGTSACVFLSLDISSSSEIKRLAMAILRPAFPADPCHLGIEPCLSLDQSLAYSKAVLLACVLARLYSCKEGGHGIQGTG
jgi:hypothetical protein